ncbi:MAG: LLM class flavin-dependent oxidoreductase [Actinomycetota bacterium]
MTVEFSTTVPATPLPRVPDMAQRLEAAGWDSLGMVDSQNLAPDPYVFLSLAATATDRLHLMTAVTNVVTRHPAVTASSAFTLQALSEGRFTLGIGRGDSALAHVGKSPARLAWFEQYLAAVCGYCRGEDVPFDAVPPLPDHIASSVDDLDLADQPDASRIRWASGRVQPVPVEVAATGAKVIGATARHADRVMFAVGAQPERVAWGVETAKAAAEESGRDPATLNFGAYVNVVAHDDPARAREIGKGSASLFIRFSAMHGTVNGPADDSQREVFETVHENYDMNHHARDTGTQASVIPDDFLDTFAIMGSVDHCVDRLGQLRELGLDKFSVAGASFSSRDPEAADAAARFIEEVAPQVR